MAGENMTTMTIISCNKLRDSTEFSAPGLRAAIKQVFVPSALWANLAVCCGTRSFQQRRDEGTCEKRLQRVLSNFQVCAKGVRAVNFIKVWQCEVLCRRHASMGRVGWNMVGYSVWEGAHVKIDRRTNLDKQDNKKQDQLQQDEIG